MKTQRLLFLSWRDIKSKKMGGAEVFTHEMLKRLDLSYYQVIHFSPYAEGLSSDEVIDGIRYIRKGNVYTVLLHAMHYYRAHKAEIDYVVNQCNTHQFFTPLWVEKKKRIFFIHQLTREIWYKNLKMPFSAIGNFLETPMLKLSKNDWTMTVSMSTKKDLLAVGFNPEKVFILPEGINFEHWQVEQFEEKALEPTFMYIGRFVNYKGIDDSIKAFAAFKQSAKCGKLWIGGKKDMAYFEAKLKPIIEMNQLTWGTDIDGKEDIIFLGFIDEALKLSCMSRAHALLFPSLREGWGLTITEAAAVGTPSIVYNSPGVIDAVDNGKAGYLCERNTVASLVGHMVQVNGDESAYAKMRQEAHKFSLNFHWSHTATSFDDFMKHIIAVEG